MSTSFSHDSPQLAETYDRVSDFQFEGGKRLVERLAISEGDRVLDVGCGTGRLARWIATRVGASGTVVGVDPLPDRIAIARANAAGVRFELGQAEDLSALASGSFDVVCMSAVFHWVDDRAKALAEVRRVLRPGGRFGATTVTRDLGMASTVADVMRSVLTGPGYAANVDLSGFALASRAQTVSELIAGILESQLDLVELHVVARERCQSSGESVVDFVQASSFGNFLRIVPEDLRSALHADLAAAFDARKGSDGSIHLRDWGTMFVTRRP